MGLAGPLIGGIATLGGAALGSKGANKAANAQSKAAADVLAFEKDKETRKRQEYDQAMTEYRQRYAQWEQQRNGLLARYGVHPGGRPSLASFGQSPMRSPTQSPMTRQAAMFGPQGMGGPNTGPTQSLLGGAPRRLSLADFSGQRPEAV